jgi:hypothetical protein
MEVRLDRAHLLPAATDHRQQQRRLTVSGETPSTWAASGCVIPMDPEQVEDLPLSSGSSPIAWSMR